MNYLELINNFWQKDTRYNFSDREIAFYLYLLSICNAQGWQNPFRLADDAIAFKFGWSKFILSTVRKSLEEVNLISCHAGKGRSNTYQYQLLSDHKATKTSPCIVDAQALSLPHASHAFANAWNTLLQMPKWADKPKAFLQANLDRLAQYDEAFATQLIQRSILGNWQGVIFKNTDTHYIQWKLEQSKTYEPSNIPVEDRKAEIVRRATLAAAACNR